MRRRMMTAGAAVLMFAGVAGAVEPARAPVAREARATSSETTSGVRGLPATRTQAQAGAVRGADVDGSGFVTRDELIRFGDSMLEQLERARNPQLLAPTFTDAG